MFCLAAPPHPTICPPYNWHILAKYPMRVLFPGVYLATFFANWRTLDEVTVIYASANCSAHSRSHCEYLTSSEYTSSRTHLPFALVLTPFVSKLYPRRIWPCYIHLPHSIEILAKQEYFYGNCISKWPDILWKTRQRHFCDSLQKQSAVGYRSLS